MKILEYSNTTDYEITTVHKDVSHLMADGVEQLIVDIKEHYQDQCPVGGISKCVDFKVVEVNNGKELVELVGFDKACMFLNIMSILEQLTL